MSFNLASCWLNWDCNRTHYTLSCNRSSLALFLPLSRVLGELIFPNAGEQIKGQNDCVAKRNGRHGIVINLTINSPMFSFTLQEVFWTIMYWVSNTLLGSNYKVDKQKQGHWVDEAFTNCQEVSCGTCISGKVIKTKCNWKQRYFCNHSQQLLFCTASGLLYSQHVKVI